jgi:enterochelin esterase family protein
VNQPRFVVSALFAATAFLAAPLRAEVRAETFRSPSLGRDVRYTVDLPSSYGSGEKRYPVVYALHGLFEGPGFWERRGLAAELARLREERAVGEFLVVCVDGGNSFFVNGPSGAFQDLVTRDIVAHVEATYRVLPGRAHRALLGVSMGGYGALRIAFLEPGGFAAVATHSAMLLEDVPSAGDGAGRWQMAAFHAVFGDPIDKTRWEAADPLLLATRADPKATPALYLDCGAEDRYGLAAGQKKLQATLTARQVPFTAELPPGDHGYEFVRARLDVSLRFLDRALGHEPGRRSDQ